MTTRALIDPVVKPIVRPVMGDESSGGGGPPPGPTNSVYEAVDTFNDYVRFADAVAEPVAGQSIEVEMEVYIRERTGEIRGLVTDAAGPREAASDTNWLMRLQADDAPRMTVITSGQQLVHGLGSIPPLNQWTTLKGVFDGTKVWMEVNGVPGNTVTVPSHIVNNPQPTWIMGCDVVGREATAFKLQQRNVKVWLNGVLRIDAPCDEASGLVCVNNAGGNGTITNERVHAQAAT